MDPNYAPFVLVAVLQSHLERPSNQRCALRDPILTRRSSRRLEPLYAHTGGADETTPARAKSVRLHQRTYVLRRLGLGSIVVMSDLDEPRSRGSPRI